jgi:hypothetical protein
LPAKAAAAALDPRSCRWRRRRGYMEIDGEIKGISATAEKS